MESEQERPTSSNQVGASQQPKRPEKPKPVAKSQPSSSGAGRRQYDPSKHQKSEAPAQPTHEEEEEGGKSKENAYPDEEAMVDEIMNADQDNKHTEQYVGIENNKGRKKADVPRLNIGGGGGAQSKHSISARESRTGWRDGHRPSTQQSMTERTVTTGHPVEQKGQQDTIEQLQTQNENFNKKIEMEKRRADELDRKMKISRGKLDDIRRSLQGRDTREEHRRLEKNIKMAENRLDLARKRLNDREAKNENIKKDIESLRRDKIQRENIVNKTKNQVDQKNEEIEKLQEEVREHTEVRDRCEKEIQYLRATIEQEAKDFEQKFQQALEESAIEQSQAEVQPAQEESMAEEDLFKQLAAGNTGSPNQRMTLAQEATLRHKSAKHSWENAKRETDRAALSKQLDAFENAFANIQEQTGISSIDEMVEAFQNSEENNYSQINMINELNKEIKELEVENSRLRSAVSEAENQGAIAEESRQEVYDEAESKLQNLEEVAREHDEKNEKALRQLESTRPGIHSIFQKLASSSDDSLTESLAATGVSDGNIMQFLGIIEQRVSELAHFYELTRSGRPLSDVLDQINATEANEDTDSPPSSQRIGGTSIARNHQPTLKPPRAPSTQDVADSEDTSSATAYRNKLQQQKSAASHLSRARESAQTIFASSAGLTNNPEGLNSSLQLLLDPSESNRKKTAAEKASNLDPVVSRKGRGLRSTEQAAREDVVKILRGEGNTKHEESSHADEDKKTSATSLRPVSVAELRGAMQLQ